jgi:hypothetical protein
VRRSAHCSVRAAAATTDLCRFPATEAAAAASTWGSSPSRTTRAHGRRWTDAAAFAEAARDIAEDRSDFVGLSNALTLLSLSYHRLGRDVDAVNAGERQLTVIHPARHSTQREVTVIV